MSGVSDTFSRLTPLGRPALIGYFPAGFPTTETSKLAIAAMIEGGVDIVEVGLPYSDPVMDGPTIQAASEQALAHGFRVQEVFGVVAASVAAGAPTVVMTYWNPVERFGVERFAEQLSAAGGSGLITPDLIPDEAEEWTTAALAHGLDQVFLVAPSSSDERLALTAQASTGFVYATSVMGVTGQRQQTSSLAPTLVARVRKVSDIPVGVGVGVSNGDQAAEVGCFADAVIVGSALVRCLLDASDVPSGLAAIKSLASELRSGIERSQKATR